VLSYTALVIRRIHLRRLLFIPILLLTAFVVLCTATDNPYRDFVKGTNMGSGLFMASDYLLLCLDVQDDIRFDGQKEGMRTKPLKERMVWAFRLFTNPRGVGTNIEATTHLPPRPSRNEPGKTYILKQIAWVAFYCPLWYMVVKFNKWNTRFSQELWLAGETLVGYPWWWQFTVWAIIIDAYMAMVVIHSVVSAISVGLNISKPHDWPPIFASPLEAYTLRRYWGYEIFPSEKIKVTSPPSLSFFFCSRMWHQLHRRVSPFHTRSTATYLISLSIVPIEPRQLRCFSSPTFTQKQNYNVLQALPVILHIRIHPLHW
jgi:hypothetical protein